MRAPKYTYMILFNSSPKTHINVMERFNITVNTSKEFPKMSTLQSPE